MSNYSTPPPLPTLLVNCSQFILFLLYLFLCFFFKKTRPLELFHGFPQIKDVCVSEQHSSQEGLHIILKSSLFWINQTILIISVFFMRKKPFFSTKKVMKTISQVFLDHLLVLPLFPCLDYWQRYDRSVFLRALT